MPQWKQVHSCQRTDVLSWTRDILPGERMHQRDWGHSPRRIYDPAGIGDIVLNITSAKEQYFNNECLDIYTAVSDDIYYT